MHRSFGDVFARRNFTALEKKYDKIDVRFKEINEVFGTQGVELRPEATSFERSLAHMMLVWVRPLLLSFVVVFVPVEFTYFKILGVMLLHHSYYLLLYFVRAVSRRDTCYYLLEFEFFSLLSLLQIVLHLEQKKIPAISNTIGWIYSFSVFCYILAIFGRVNVLYVQDL